MLTQFVTPAKYIWAKLTYFNPSICWSWNDEGWLCGKCARVRLWEFSIVKRLKGPVIYDNSYRCAVLWKWKGSSQWATDSRVIYGSYCCDIVFLLQEKKGKWKVKISSSSWLSSLATTALVVPCSKKAKKIHEILWIISGQGRGWLRFNREIMTMIMVKTMWRDIRAMTLMLGLHW